HHNLRATSLLIHLPQPPPPYTLFPYTTLFRSVVNQSVKLIRKRSAGLSVQVRPWLQDFKDYAFDKRIFGVTEIRAQIRGTDEGGGVGWMLWNPRNDYTGAALRPKGPIASR